MPAFLSPRLATLAAVSWATWLLVGPTPLAAQAFPPPRPNQPAGGPGVTPVQMLVPGFAARALPLELPNITAVRYRGDGKLVALTFNGKVYLLSDTDGDGLEDQAAVFYDPGQVHLSLDFAFTPAGYPGGKGVFIARKGNLALELDTDGDDRADQEIIVADKWESPKRFPGGASDTIGVAVDPQGNVYFGLGAANSQNGYLLEKGVASYKVTSERGSLLKMPADLSRREIVATGIRAAFGMEFNAGGDLFATDQEGATWMANGNPFDELLHLQPGRHYGFPPRHPKFLPDVIDEPSVIDYGPQHQSTCGLFFNDPVNGGPVFGPAWWRGDAFVAGESRGKLYRTKLVKTPSGYVGQNQIIACLGWLTIDQCVSPGGDLVIAAHSGPPDWGTGANGIGKLFKVSRVDAGAAQPVLTYAASPTELHVAFDQPLPADAETDLSRRVTLTAGPYVREGDRFETFRPGYRAVDLQQAAPRQAIAVRAVRVSADRRNLVLETEARTTAVPCSIDIDGWPRGGNAQPGDLPQKSVLGVLAESTGVEVTWKSQDGKVTWSGWLPHLDLQVARELTAGSAAHDQLWSLVGQAGTLTLRAQLDLWNMLRPALQPGERLDYSLPAESVNVSFDAGHGPAPRLAFTGTTGSPAVETKASATRWLRHSPRERAWVPIELTLPTGGKGTPTLHVSWTTREDPRPRALALRRVFAPWTTPPPAAEAAKPAPPPELIGADRQRGRQLFAMCSVCHGLNSEGFRVGPDLSNLLHRDYASVVKDIADPNATINPDYVSYVITLKNGETRTAVILENQPGSLLLATPGGAPVELPKTEVATMTASKVSLMPAGMDQALGPQGMKDLLAYLMLPESPATKATP